MSRIVGIDLGTTNSLVAYVEREDRPAPGDRRSGRAGALAVDRLVHGRGCSGGRPAKRQLVRRPGRPSIP